MKKIFLLIVTSVFALTSCDELFDKLGQDIDDTPGVIEKPDNNGEPTEELKPSAQKAKLEEIAEAFMDEYPANEFEEFFELSSKFNEKYLGGMYWADGEERGYNWDEFYEYCQAKGEEMFFYTDKEYKKGGEIYREWNVEGFLEFSQLHGILTLGENAATCRDYDGTKMIFTLDGVEYVAELTTSGNTLNAIYDYEDIYGYENYEGHYDEQTGYWVDDYVMVHYNYSYHFEVSVPEKISIVLTKDGADYAVVDMSFVRRFNEAGISLTTDCFQITATVTIDGHSVVIDKTGYDAATGKAGMSYLLKKGTDVIIKAVATADVKVNLVTETDEWDNYYDDYVYPEFTLAKDFDVYVDILGQLQVVGNCTDGLSLADYMENFYNSSTESQAERAIDNINNYVDLGIYYDKSVTRQADIIMDYYVYTDDYNDETWYELEPIIKFPDGSKYAFYEYFDEDSFSGLSSSFDLWLSLYETMLEHYFD